MSRSIIIAARRSAVVPRNGAFKALEVHELAAPVIGALLQDGGIDAGDVGELILSNALGGGGNPARLAALAAELPLSVGGVSIDRQCAGGLDAVLLADALVRSGQHDVVIAGGAESYSRRPLRLRTFADGRDPEAYDRPPFSPWPERDPELATAADALGVPQVAQENWAMESHRKAMAADFTGEIVPILSVERDAFTRNLTARHCAKAPIIHGNVTSATTAVAADAAAFVLVVSERVANRLGKMGVVIRKGATLGAAPEDPGLAPIAAIETLGVSVEHISTIELMEAYAAQAIACQDGAVLPIERINPKGGALARGHPIGASGAILAVRLFHDLASKGGTGLAAIAAAGGLGTAVLFES